MTSAEGTPPPPGPPPPGPPPPAAPPAGEVLPADVAALLEQLDQPAGADEVLAALERLHERLAGLLRTVEEV